MWITESILQFMAEINLLLRMDGGKIKEPIQKTVERMFLSP